MRGGPGDRAGLRLHVCRDHEELSGRAAEIVAEALRKKPDLLLCAASGASPVRCYALLAEAARREPSLAARLRVVKLDEWAGLGPDDPASCEAWLRAQLLGPLGVTAERSLGLRGEAAAPELECLRVSRLLAERGPIDLCLLGLGLNGHLGFNEPAAALKPMAHVADLSPETLRHPMLKGARRPVRQGLTLGMAELLGSRRVLLLVSGPGKRDALRRLLTGALTTRFPASLLALHRDALLLCDREALGDEGLQA